MKQSLTLMRTNLFPIISTKQKTCIADTNVDQKKSHYFNKTKKLVLNQKRIRKN